MGVVAAHFVPFSAVVLAVFLFGVCSLWLRRKRLAIFLILISLLAGGCRHEIVFRRLENIAVQKEELVTIQGKIAAEPVQKEDYQRLIVPPAVIYTDRYPRYRYGDTVSVEGKIRPLGEFRSYGSVMVSGQMSYPAVTLVSEAGFSIRGAALAAKEKIIASLQKIIPEPQASLAAGLIFGSKNYADEIWETRIRQCGLSHVVVASGLHLSVMTKFLAEIWEFLSVSGVFNFISSFAFVWGFAFMTGLAPSMTRAALMASLLLLSRVSCRLYDSFNALLLAAVAMVGCNPLILFWDLGFQFSFLATAGIILLYPIWQENSFWQKEWFAGKGKILKETMLASFSALALVMPWAAWQTESWSLAAPFTNLLVVPVVPWAMVGGMITSFFSFLFHPLGMFFGLGLNLILKYFLRVILIFSSFSWSQIAVVGCWRWLIVPYYLVLFWYIYRHR